MSTIFEFSVLFRGYVELHGKHEQERAVSGLSSIDSLILSRGSPYATAELEEEFIYFRDAGYEVLFCYFGDVLNGTGSMSLGVEANIWRDAQEFCLQKWGYLDQYMTPVCQIDYCNNEEEDVRRSVKAFRKSYQKWHQLIVLEAPLVIKVNESHELTLSSSNEYFASWLANADSNFIYKKLIRPVFSALEQKSESIAKVHTGALRISGPSSAEASADSKSGTDSELSLENHDAGIISCDCALMPSALLGRNTYKFGIRHGLEDSFLDILNNCVGRNGLVSESRSLSLPEHIFDKGKGLVFVIGHELYLDMMSRFDLSRYEDFLGREREDGPQLEALELFLEKVPNCVFMVLWPEKDYCAIKPADEDDDNSVTLLHDLEEDTDAAASGDDTRTCSSAGVLYRWWPLPEGKSSDRSWPRKVGFVMASADRMAQDLKSLYKVQCQKDGRERDRQKEYWYLRFVKNPERNIMVLDYTHTKAMLFSPECLECSWQDNSVKLPLLFGYEMELVDMVNLPSVEFNDVQSLVAIAHAVPLDYLPDSSVRIPADLLDHFYIGYYPEPDGISYINSGGYKKGPSLGFTQQGAQRLVDRLALETKYDLLDLNKYLERVALKATISPDSFDDEMRLVFLQMRYSPEKYIHKQRHSYTRENLDRLMMRGFEWINDVIDFCKSFRHSGLTSKLLSHKGLACINNLELLICQAVYDFPVLRKLFDSESWVKEARDLRKLFSCVLSRHENSPEFRSLISCSWCRPDQEMLHLMRADSNAVSFDEPVAVVDAEFLMGNFRNIRKAAGNRTIVIPLTVLNALSVCRGHFDLPLKLISSHAQRAVIKLGDKAVYYVPDFNFTSMVARAGQKNQNTEPDEASESCDVSITDIYSAFMTADDDSEDNDLDSDAGSEEDSQDSDAGSEEDSQDSSICSYSCISTAICLQAYDTVLYTGNEETARKAEQLGVKTVLSDAVTGAYRKQAKLINKLVTQDQSNAEELSCNEDVGYASTYDISMSLIDNAMKDLSWKHCYDTGVMGSMDLSEKHAKAVLDLQLKLLTEADRASYLLNLYSHNPGIYHDFVRMASRPGTDSVYREQLLGLRRGRTAAARLMTDERTLITAEDMKVQIDHFMDWYESSEEQSEGGDS